MKEQDPKDRIREMSVLNLIMLIGIAIGFGIGILIDNMIGGIAIGMLGAFICRLLYIRKKYKEINPKDKKEQAHLLHYSFFIVIMEKNEWRDF